MRVLDTAQMREADRRTIDDLGVPARSLMENAGREVVSVLDDRFDDLAGVRVTIFAGKGNNGGDGFVVARLLARRGIPVTVALCAVRSEVSGDARATLDALADLDVRVDEVPDLAAWQRARAHLLDTDLAIDALVGTGLKGSLSGLLAAIVEDLNATSVPVVAIDVPSGLSTDTPDLPGPAVHAAITVALAAPKIPHVMPPAEHVGGQLVVADIGIPRSIIDTVPGPRIEILTADDLRDVVQPRPADAHKGHYGHVLVIAGSRGKTGAAVLAARAALRSGAGLVTVATPASVWPIVAASTPEIMTLPLAETADGTVSAEAIEAVLSFGADVIAAGPGLGTSPDVSAFVHGLLSRTDVGLVLDADALNACVSHVDRLAGRENRPVVITPHPGEMARLLGITSSDVQARRIDVARDLAGRLGAHVVLKGYRTILAAPDGDVSVNMTGNPGMATGGSGDVLTGVIAGWWAQLRDVTPAVRLGVFLHGLAGDLAAQARGESALIAGDIVDQLGSAVLDLTARRPRTGARRS